MRFPIYSARQRAFLLALAVFGAVVPNGLFLYYAALHRQLLIDTLSNPVALVFICEAFALMLLFAWLLHRSGVRNLSPWRFILFSLLGSMLFSVPFALYRLGGEEQAERGQG